MDCSASLPIGQGAPLVCNFSAVPAVRAAQWRPGQNGASHSEIFAEARDASGAGVALALAMDCLRAGAGGSLAEAEDRRAVLWVQDRAALRQTGRPYMPGLPPAVRHRLVHVAVEKPEDALFALEEGLRCHDLACVIGEIAGNPRALDFTASRRLTLTAQRHGVPLWLVRIDATRDLSSARLRWQVRPAASRTPQWNAQAPGAPRWHAELFRARSHPPGEWILSDDGQQLAVDRPGTSAVTPHPVGLVFAAGGRSLAAG